MKPELPWPPWKQEKAGLDLDEASRGGVCLTDLLSFRIAGRCQEMSTLLQKTDEPGKYTACESLTCDGCTQPPMIYLRPVWPSQAAPWPEKPPLLQLTMINTHDHSREPVFLTDGKS